GPPGLVITIARILASSPPAANRILFSDRSKTAAEERRPAGRRCFRTINERSLKNLTEPPSHCQLGTWGEAGGTWGEAGGAGGAGRAGEAGACGRSRAVRAAEA